MKFVLSLLLLRAVAAFAAPAFSPEAAAKKFDAGDYLGAAAAYREGLSADPGNPDLHYNLGNCFFKAGRLGPAIVEYQRAFDALPRDSDIRHNLDFALKRAGEDLTPAGVPPILFAAFHWLGARELAGLHWLSCWAALLLAGAWLIKDAWRPALGAWCAGALALWLCGGGWWLARTGFEPESRGVVLKPAAEIRSGPGESFSVSFTVPEGRRVQILSASGDWVEIGLPKEGAKGWMRSDAVEEI